MKAKPKHKPEPDWRAQFLESLAKNCNVKAACKLVGINRRTAYKARETNPDFATRWRDALDDGIDALELEARRRAKGWKEPVYSKNGELVGHVRKYSDLLLIFLLRAHRPEMYRDGHESAGTEGQKQRVILEIYKREDDEPK